MKKKQITIVYLLMSAVVCQAGIAPSILPESSYYNGRHSFSFDLGSEGVLNGHLEFAVYKDNEAQIMQDWTGHTGDSDYVYAYQVFSDQSSTAALTYFALTGINPDTIADVQNDIGENESLDSGNIQSAGIAPESSDFDFGSSDNKAVWQFAEGALVQNEQSWFLFLYSDNDWIVGDIEVQAANDDVPVPGDEIPEPATLALLLGGTMLSMRRKK